MNYVLYRAKVGWDRGWSQFWAPLANQHSKLEKAATYEASPEGFGSVGLGKKNKRSLDQMIADELLRSAVFGVSSADKHLKGVRQANLDRQFDAILMDVHMPILEGFLVSSRQRNLRQISSQQLSVRALLVKAQTLQKLGSKELSLSAYDDIIVRFSSDSDPVVREQVARAYLSKGELLSELGLLEMSIVCCEAAVSLLQGEFDQSLQGSAS